jgi:pyrimidine operon attenuation protein/uracil phosphoribosyltransferase
MKTILDKKQIDSAIKRLVGEISSDYPSGDFVLVGMRSRGEIIADRMIAELNDKFDNEIPCGTLDITLYRDDINDPQGDEQMVVRATEITFDVTDKVVILVDDVLHTGRSVRAAMDALIDLGRPKVIRLAVLVERWGREFPIQADYIAHKVDIGEEESVQVLLKEIDKQDKVVIEAS